ncbi:SRPBCC family protein [Edaphobacter albus]|uniref:SRPBCC family protein n=1 Tax=Edaphobacter sp. 4G125 TaxID=2763071 RepID=UPI0016442F2C|nr:SRPBCC family protein [Edaphobacter sp. 4G125]QNI37211.1 SRPBCC domain-containing protein [Edaphobacter sp. 4G125]
MTDREISDTRIVDATRELLWTIWTEPEHVIQWWGPEGFTNTTEKMDVRAGGEWNHVMHGPDGTDYINRIVYREVVKPEKLVFDHISVPYHRTTVVFEDIGGGKTKLSFHMIFDTTEEKRYVAEKFKAESGLKQTLNRMEEYLARQ